MEMSLKAFLLQKQHKDTALNKLTKVHHGEDYAKFELEYYGFHQKNVGKVLESSCIKRVTLPSIKKQNMVGVLVRNLPVSINKDGCYKRSSYQSSNIEKYNKMPNFPHLNSTLPVSLIANERSQSRSVLHLMPLTNYNFRVTKRFSGNTEVLLVKHNKNDLTVSEVDETKNTSRNNHSSSDQGNAATKLLEDHYCNVSNDLAEKVNYNKATDSAVEFERVSKSYDGNMKVPVLDHRFELLQKVLVRQDPPNDGFIELSPSFVKRNSLQSITDKSAYLNKEDGLPSMVTRRDSNGDYQPSDTENIKSCRNKGHQE